MLYQRKVGDYFFPELLAIYEVARLMYNWENSIVKLIFLFQLGMRRQDPISVAETQSSREA
jgi:hypothetical protein